MRISLILPTPGLSNERNVRAHLAFRCQLELTHQNTRDIRVEKMLVVGAVPLALWVHQARSRRTICGSRSKCGRLATEIDVHAERAFEEFGMPL